MALSLALVTWLAGGDAPRLWAQAPSSTADGVPEHVVESDRDFLRGGKPAPPAADQTAQPPPGPTAAEPESPAASKKRKKKAHSNQPPVSAVPLETTVEEVRALLTDYLQAGQTADVRRQLAFFAERVDYFEHGVVNRAFIRQDLINYNLRWPVRSYQLGRDVQLRPGMQPGVVQANFTLAFSVRSPEKSERGSTFNTALLRQENGRWKIVTIKGKAAEPEAVIGSRGTHLGGRNNLRSRSFLRFLKALFIHAK